MTRGRIVYRVRVPVIINILVDIFLLKVLGWCTPGISGGPTSTPPPCITCGTVQLFFDFLLRQIIFVSARLASCFLTFQLLPANGVFCHNTILNLFAIISPFLYSKLDFLPFVANLPPVHYLRNGPAVAFLLFPPFALYLHEASSAEISPSTPPQRFSSAAQRRAVPCPAMPCRALQLSSAAHRSASSAERSAVLCRALSFCVLCCTFYLFVHASNIRSIIPRTGTINTTYTRFVHNTLLDHKQCTPSSGQPGYI